MERYNVSVAEEKSQLDSKLSYLKEFFMTDIFANISPTEQSMFRIQYDVMSVYSNILGLRLRYFKAGYPKVDK